MLLFVGQGSQHSPTRCRASFVDAAPQDVLDHVQQGLSLRGCGIASTFEFNDLFSLLLSEPMGPGNGGVCFRHTPA